MRAKLTQAATHLVKRISTRMFWASLLSHWLKKETQPRPLGMAVIDYTCNSSEGVVGQHHGIEKGFEGQRVL